MIKTPHMANNIENQVDNFGFSPIQIQVMRAARKGVTDKMKRVDATDVYSIAKTYPMNVAESNIPILKSMESRLFRNVSGLTRLRAQTKEPTIILNPIDR